MALLTKAVKGTQDLLPAETAKQRYLESTLFEIAESFGFKEIRTPVFEHTELFQRGVGETTDVVQKEMYTFDDKGGRSVTLRPEGTAGAVRAFLEHGLFNESLPQKLCYLLNCYRYEKPQAGRWREFQQFGVEMFGSADPSSDAEVISIAYQIFSFLGVEDLELQINSIGCPECRKKYHEALKNYFKQYKTELCDTCNDRLEKNPMRILDCKSPVCKKISENSPVIIDYLCDDCREHFEGVKKYLDSMGINYTVNPRSVRGLDYYTRTVFEFVSNAIGAQGTVCGGGRYDLLVEELGGPKTPALGFGMGTGRLKMLLSAQGIELPGDNVCEIYIAPTDKESSYKVMSMVTDLRASGIHAETDVVGRSLKAQMKYADKIGARYTTVIGSDELAAGKVKVKNMSSGSVAELDIDNFEDNFLRYTINETASDLADDVNTDTAFSLTDYLDNIN
ncbi:MAG: histidine--tRNA ligase [Clostridia bacterium]|nr:histidine--tRNA ligase [Clostridia bacterium]